MALHLSLDERRILARMLQQKISAAEIARHLGRHRSTLHREIRRNFWHDREVPLATGYWHMTAQQLSDAQRSRKCKLHRYPEVRMAVIDALRQGWSPEQIAGRMKFEGHTYRVCHETIYRFVYSRDGQSQELA